MVLTFETVALPFAYGFVVSVLLVPLCKKLALRAGIVAQPRADRWHRQVIPLLGGVAIMSALLVGTVATGVASHLAVPLGCAIAIFLVGLVDDATNLKPSTKLIALIGVASALVLTGYRLNWLESRTLDSLLTIIWVVGLANAFNLLDNMDGLCAGTGLIAATMMTIGLLTGVTREIAGNEIQFLIVLGGAIAGFLVYNLPPASIFMGDSGSLLIGFTLATFTLSAEGIRASRSDILAVIAAPVFVLLVPIFDTTLVTVSRLLSGRSPARGGRDHSSHRLVAIGLSERRAVFLLWTLAGAGGGIGLTLRFAAEGLSLVVGSIFLLAMSIFAVYLARVRVYDESEVARDRLTPLVVDFMYKRRVAEVMLDFCLVSIAYYGAYRLRFEGGEYLRNFENFYASLPVVLCAQLVAYFIVGVYRGVWHYFGLMDAVVIGKGVVLGTAASQLAIFYIYDEFGHSRTVFLIYGVLLLMLTMASRASFRLIGEFLQHQRTSGQRAVIYGAGENAQIVLRELNARDATVFRILGIIDDDPKIARMRVQGYSVLGDYSALKLLITTSSIDAVILTRHLLDVTRLAELKQICEANDVAILRLHIGLEEVSGRMPVVPSVENPPQRRDLAR
jgi:UDP-GlcNAc:undecaprenyl-phosphate GlcNAc-1-phosphate transferase